jgi:hypothetical protein
MIDEVDDFSFRCFLLNRDLDLILNKKENDTVVMAVLLEKIKAICCKQEKPLSSLEQVIVFLQTFHFNLMVKQVEQLFLGEEIAKG